MFSFLSTAERAFHLEKLDKAGYVHFRTTQDPFIYHHAEAPSRRGLNSLHASASGQLTKKELISLKNKLGVSSLAVIDLRGELHGFINDMPVCFKESAYTSIKDEQNLFSTKKAKHVVLVEKNQKQRIAVKNMQTEAEIVRSANTEYIRIPIIDHTVIAPEHVQQFLQFYDTLSASTTMHFHCRKGKGRATTLMTMLDMLINSNKVSCDDIIRRQYLIGGAQIDTKLEYDNHRKFFRDFYQFCQARKTGEKSWIRWLARQSKD